jgi:NAD-dependent SIR2 family protein deacetylase
MVAHARPNAAHRALAALEHDGRIERLVTQNVDGLHQRAGSRDVIDLHGTHRCGALPCCGALSSRDEVQHQLIARNPEWTQAVDAADRPDGDADLDAIDTTSFVAPHCDACEGLLKPDVVFFGENVPRDRVFDAQAALQASDAMLVVGSSLMVYSGYRFAVRAREAGLPLAILTSGTDARRCHRHAQADADSGETLGNTLKLLGIEHAANAA